MSEEMANRYKAAEEIVWGRLAKWKQNAIKEDRTNNPNSRYLSEFAKEIIQLAESGEELILTPNKISAPALTMKDGKFHVSQSNQ